MRTGALAAALVLCAGGCASATPAVPTDPNLTCRLTHPARYVDSLKLLPPAIQAALKHAAGGMADRGEPFNATDVVSKPAPFNRFIRGGISGTRWFVWYEHGGFAYWHAIAIFGTDPAKTAPINVPAAQTNLCAATDKLLDGGTP